MVFLCYQVTIKNTSAMDGIKIQLGQVTMNKTARFIKPCLRYYGEEFVKKLSSVFKLAYGIGDMIINDKVEHQIFILVDTVKCTRQFIDVIEWLRNQDYYENDYAVDHLIKGRMHMLVIRLPENTVDLNLFLSGKYSKMYKDEEVIDVLSDDDRAIVIKDNNYRIKFVKKVNEYFQTNLKVEELHQEAELELPPNIDEQEFFNIIES